MIGDMNGAKAWDCYQAYINFIHYLPAAERYKEGFEDREQISNDFKTLTVDEKRAVIIDVMGIYPIPSREMIKLIGIHKRENGSYITPQLINNYHIKDLAEMVFESLLRCNEESDQVFF
ncbi:hypothetical protein [Aliivibrio fischeri]|uniref:Uncharacterized protein n=1 Tax=Aliivibrio fischeri SR5 TaxID=1088719 RepID=A0AAV3EVM7_ALIFS|nr:hypothetical protein [Aliivibrio fischeri]EHN70922.1 hypothetical protein VFSR5_0702 [Aliivibrio fischeri SR5]